MKMKKSQLKEAVKAVVRQCLNERLAKEGCGSGSNKRFKGKEGRRFKHVEDSEKEQGKSTKVAKKIAGATVNKHRADEQVGADVVAGEGMGNDAAQTPMDDIIKHVIKKVPAIAGNPQKIAHVSSLLFQKQFGGQRPPDQETLLGLVQKHIQGGGEEQSECGMEEAGLTSETGEEAEMPVGNMPGGEEAEMPVGNMPGDEEGEEHEEHEEEHEREEIMLIKVMALIAKKLEALHAGMPGSEEEPSIAAVSDEEPSEEPAKAPPFGGGEEKPEEEPSEEPKEKPEKEEEPKDDDGDEIKEGSAKTQTQGYRVAPNPSTLTQKTDDEKEKPTDPRLTEKKDKWIQKAVDPKHKGYCTPMTKSTCTPRRKALAKRFKKGIDETKVNMKMGPQYRVAPKASLQVTEPDQPARVNQYTPSYPVKEGHKVQARSYKTVNDMDNKPENVEDPENPMS